MSDYENAQSFAQYLSSDAVDKDWLAMAGPSMPTPPPSESGQSPQTSEGCVTVSTVFYPGAELPFIQDLALLTSDQVYFYVNLNKIMETSYNMFGGLLGSNLHADLNTLDVSVVEVGEKSDVLNVILHCIFDISCAAYAPTFELLARAVSKMPAYGLQPANYLASGSPLFSLLLAQGPLFPLEVYTIASKYGIEELAVPVSSHLLSFPLSKVTDDLAVQIGPSYLRRLFFLHLGRTDALKRLLLSPPYPHPPTSTCGFGQQKNLTRAWSLASAYIAWDARADMSNSAIKSAFSSLTEQLSCDQCKAGLLRRLDDVLVNWSQIKYTI